MVIVIYDEMVSCGLYSIKKNNIELLDYEEFYAPEIIVYEGIIYNSVLLKKYITDFVKNRKNIEGILYVFDCVIKENTLVFYASHIQCLLFSHFIKISFLTILPMKKISSFAKASSFRLRQCYAGQDAKASSFAKATADETADRTMDGFKNKQLLSKKNSELRTYCDMAIQYIAKELI